MLATVIGNRPQLIKMAPVSAELKRRGYDEHIIHSGQHYDENMSGVFFRELGIAEPGTMLQVKGTSHGHMTAEILEKLEDVFLKLKPNGVLIYGDTNTTLAAALAAVKLRIPIAHIEAGPRIYDMDTPEEINRIVADHAARLRFCPDQQSVENLRKENITSGVFQTGDLMYDAYKEFSPVAERQSTLLASVGLDDGRPFAFMTVHRPNNTDSKEALRNLIAFLDVSPITVLFAVHPRTEAACKRFGLWDTLNAVENVKIVPALGYLDVLAALKHAAIVLTDSGGLQKEAYFAAKPALVMFHVTPWPQLQKLGWTDPVGCLGEISPTELAQKLGSFQILNNTRPPLFGNGDAAKQIVDVLENEGWFK